MSSAIEFVDTTIRDGNQSLWSATGLTTPEVLEIAPTIDRVGYHVVEFLLPLYDLGKPAKRYSQKLAELQEELGAFNDMATTAALLSGIGGEALEGATARAAIAGWQAHAMVGSEARLRAAWSEFSKTKTPWSRPEEA